MIYETRLEQRTSGLVCGPAVIASELPLIQRLGVDARKRRIILADAVPLAPALVTVHYKLIIRAREGGEVLWVRPFLTRFEAGLIYARLIGIDPGNLRGPLSLPGIWQDGELEYQFAVVTTYNSTTNNSGSDWSVGGTACPTGVSAADYLVISGGGGGGAFGGGGAGGYLEATGLAVTAGTNYPVTIGAGGNDNGGSYPSGAGSVGAASSWNSVAPTGGGAGGGNINNASSGGSGGGGGDTVTRATGTGGQGLAGGLRTVNTMNNGGGGGGKNQQGGDAVSDISCGIGGNGLASSISGSSVTRAAGAGGATNGGIPGGAGGTGGGGTGAGSANPATAGGANTGSGGGGNLNTAGNAGKGGSGVAILSFTPLFIFIPYNRLQQLAPLLAQ
jgi:hypothetical protein